MITEVLINLNIIQNTVRSTRYLFQDYETYGWTYLILINFEILQLKYYDITHFIWWFPQLQCPLPLILYFVETNKARIGLVHWSTESRHV